MKVSKHLKMMIWGFFLITEISMLIVIFVLLAAFWIYPQQTFLAWQYPKILSCALSSPRAPCYQDTAFRYLDQRGPDYAQVFLASVFAAGSIDQNKCHTLAHNLGEEVIKRGYTLEEVFTHAKSFCAYGYTHGVLAAMSKNKIEHGIVKEGTDACQRYSGQSCLHGLGHALMYMTDYDLPKALHLCDTYSTNLIPGPCYDGVFMEYSLSSLSPNHVMSSQEVQNPLMVCNTIEDQYRLRCYWQSVPIRLIKFARMTPVQPSTVADVGKEIVPRMRPAFWHGIGKQVDALTGGNAKDIFSFCAQLPLEAQQGCLEGAARNMILVDGGSTDRANIFCLSLRPEQQSSCVSLLTDPNYPDNLVKK